MIKTIIGLAAGFCTAASFIPQVIKIYRSKRTSDLSLPTWIIYVLGTILWIAYGVLIKSIPVFITNIIIMLCTAYILIMKIRYK